ncbi:MAG: FAD-dependent monooxygenase [Singulisphaera sp.]
MNELPTIRIEEAATRTWDAVVIGAGPAGAVAARELARKGAATLLVERYSLPRAKICGGCLNGRALATLECLGLEHVLAQSHAARIDRFLVYARKHHVAVDLPAGVAIQRAAFDVALTRAAIDAGAAFLPETAATVVAEISKGAATRTILLSQREPDLARATARVVIAADGLGHSSLRNLPVFHSRTSAAARVGLGVTVPASAAPVSYESGAIHMGVSSCGYAGLVRTADDVLNVAAAVDPVALRQASAPAALINQVLRDAQMPSIPGLETETCRGTLPLTRSSGRCATERVFVVGDAAGYVEPFTGEGMAWAMQSATSVVPVALELAADWDEARAWQWERAQRRQIAKGQVACRVLAGLLRWPRVVDLTLATLHVIPGVAAPFVRHIHGGATPIAASVK